MTIMDKCISVRLEQPAYGCDAQFMMPAGNPWSGGYVII